MPLIAVVAQAVLRAFFSRAAFFQRPISLVNYAAQARMMTRSALNNVIRSGYIAGYTELRDEHDLTGTGSDKISEASHGARDGALRSTRARYRP